jgi:hypothetical protein
MYVAYIKKIEPLPTWGDQAEAAFRRERRFDLRVLKWRGPPEETVERECYSVSEKPVFMEQWRRT